MVGAKVRGNQAKIKGNQFLKTNEFNRKCNKNRRK
jgi:hypothetical protein